MNNLPQEFKNNMINLLGKKSQEYFDSLDLPPKKGVVLNTNLLSEDEILKLINVKRKIPFSETGYLLENGEEKLGNTWVHHAGLIYLQEPSSMAPVAAAGGLENKKVLDLCASPGGKTIDISIRQKGTGLLVSNEIVYKRAKILFQNIERCGLKNCIVTSNSPEELASEFVEFFDVIFVDAPCSGEGMFRKDPNTICEWNKDIPAQNKKRQIEILTNANKMLKTGGELIYSTCTFNTTENEEVVKLLTENGYQIEKTDANLSSFSQNGIKKVCKNSDFACRFYPQDGVGEGQFVCRLRKTMDAKIANCAQNNIKSAQKNEKTKQFCKNNGQNIKIVDEFLKSTLNDTRSVQYNIQDNRVYAVINQEVENKKLNFVARGINVGEIVKDRLEPHHQFFKVYGKDCKQCVNLTAAEVEKYLDGQEIDASNMKNGYACAMFNGAVLGGGKVAAGKLKNYYPKGLRSKINKI